MWNIDYKKTMVRVRNLAEYWRACRFYEDKWYKVNWLKEYFSHYDFEDLSSEEWETYIFNENNKYIDRDPFFREVFLLRYPSHREWLIDITKEVLWKDTWWIEKYIKDFTKQQMNEPFFKKFLPFKKDKPMTTLAQEIFDRFLKTNKTKVIETVERANTIIEEVTPLLKPFNELSLELMITKKTLEAAFDDQNKEEIKLYLKELQEINSIYNDKLFDQLKTILKAINKSLSH